MGTQFQTEFAEVTNLRRVYDARNQKDFANLVSLILSVMKENLDLRERLERLEPMVERVHDYVELSK